MMKSERAGRLARDSAEILVGDRPGEFTVVTQEGSSIPVDVSDLTESTSSKKEPSNDPTATAEAQRPAEAHSATAPAAVGAAAPAETPGPDPVAKKSTWLGSMMAAGTAALGLKGGTQADAGSSSASSAKPAEAEPAPAVPAPAQDAPAAAAAGQEAPPILNIASTDPKAEPSPVSAFASEVAVQPVSATTTDSSPIEGKTSSFKHIPACDS